MSVSSRILAGLVSVTSALVVPAACVAGAEPTPVKDGREYLVPALSEHPFHVDGERTFLHRLSLSPGYGTLGSETLYALRFGYNPSTWLGWEASIEHNPGQSVHALLHTLDAVVRYPLPGRLQPYARLGYGMILVYPGESLNADPAFIAALADIASTKSIWRSSVKGDTTRQRKTIDCGKPDTETNPIAHR